MFALDCLSSSDADEMGISSALLSECKNERSANEIIIITM